MEIPPIIGYDVLDTSNFLVQANSGSEKAISEQIIDALVTERPLLTVSDPEPSHLHQKLTNKRLYKDELDPIRNIVNIPGRMHIEMDLLTSISTYPPSKKIKTKQKPRFYHSNLNTCSAISLVVLNCKGYQPIEGYMNDRASQFYPLIWKDSYVSSRIILPKN